MEISEVRDHLAALDGVTEQRRDGRPDTFSVTPPIEAHLKVLLRPTH